MKDNCALISIETDLMGGQDRLKFLMQQLQEMGRVAQTSSIYKKYRNHRSEDLNSNLVLAIKWLTEKNLDEVFCFLTKLETDKEKVLGGNREALSILAFNQELLLMPGQNIPHPKLHTDPLTLRCAAEAWSDYKHPVLGQTLNELVRCSDPVREVEFFAQGKSLFSNEI